MLLLEPGSRKEEAVFIHVLFYFLFHLGYGSFQIKAVFSAVLYGMTMKLDPQTCSVYFIKVYHIKE
jgi:hypothetical protein